MQKSRVKSGKGVSRHGMFRTCPSPFTCIPAEQHSMSSRGVVDLSALLQAWWRAQLVRTWHINPINPSGAHARTYPRRSLAPDSPYSMPHALADHATCQQMRTSVRAPIGPKGARCRRQGLCRPGHASAAASLSSARPHRLVCLALHAMFSVPVYSTCSHVPERDRRAQSAP